MGTSEPEGGRAMHHTNGRFQKHPEPKYRPQNSRALITRTTKKGPLLFGSSQMWLNTGGSLDLQIALEHGSHWQLVQHVRPGVLVHTWSLFVPAEY